MKFYDYFSKIYIRELWTLGTKFIVISKIYIRYNWFEIWNMKFMLKLSCFDKNWNMHGLPRDNNKFIYTQSRI